MSRNRRWRRYSSALVVTIGVLSLFVSLLALLLPFCAVVVVVVAAVVAVVDVVVADVAVVDAAVVDAAVVDAAVVDVAGLPHTSSRDKDLT